jgi:hypothetical protein
MCGIGAINLFLERRALRPEGEQFKYNLCIMVEDHMTPVEIKSAGILQA